MECVTIERYENLEPVFKPKLKFAKKEFEKIVEKFFSNCICF